MYDIKYLLLFMLGVVLMCAAEWLYSHWRGRRYAEIKKHIVANRPWLLYYVPAEYDVCVFDLNYTDLLVIATKRHQRAMQG